MPTIQQLMEKEIHAYHVWKSSQDRDASLYRKAIDAHQAVKAHPDYRGVR